MDYIKGIIFLTLFILFLNFLGKKFSKKSRFTLNIIYGYLIYTFFQAIGGILTQILKIDYIYYKCYMILLVAILALLSSHELIEVIKSKNLKKSFIDHFHHHYILYIIAAGLLLCSLLMTNYLWVGNHQDDGWYLLKVAQAPYLGNNYDISYATGFHSNLGIVRGINTFELDYAFWSNVLGIYPTIFCKATMSFFNYFLTLCCFAELLSALNKNEDTVMPRRYFLYLLPIFIFALPSETLANHHLLTQQDGWHFSTAIWYGSGILQAAGPLLLLIPVFQMKKIHWYSIFIYGAICLVLMSKASQALPLIILCSSIIFLYIFKLYQKDIKDSIAIALVMLACLACVPQLIATYTDIKTYMSTATLTYFESPIILLSVAALFISAILFRKNKKILYLVAGLTLVHTLIFLPNVNNIFMNSAIYTFVAGRTITTLGFITVISAGLCFGLSLEYIGANKQLLKCLYIVGATGILLVFSVSHYSNIGIMNSLLLLKENPRLIPESTIDLSTALANFKDHNLTVLTESWEGVSHNHAHALATSLRIEATNIKVISAIHRFSEMDDDSIYKDFDLEKQMIYENFVKYPTDKKAITKLDKLLKKYPIDIIITTEPSALKSLQKNFKCKLIQKVSTENERISYYILKFN